MAPTHAELQRIHTARTGLRQLHRWSTLQLSAAGLTPALHDLILAIQVLENAAAPSITAAAKALALTHHSTVDLVNRAQATGHVQRAPDPQDGRVVRLSLTPQGQQALSGLAPHHREQLHRLHLLVADTSDNTG